MKKTAFVLILICLMALGVVCVRPIRAQSQSNITINADGSISPSYAPVSRLGDIYTLTGEVNGTISLDRNNTVFNGNGNIITHGLSIGDTNAPNYGWPTAGVSYTSNTTVENFIVRGGVFGITLDSVSNVTVANNTITGTGNGILSLNEPTAGIYVEGGDSNIIKGNNISNNYNAMSFVESVGNLVVENNITNNHNPNVIVSALMFWGASNNTIYHNNFINNTSPAGDAAYNSPSSVNVWDDGYPFGGNYWSDYQTTYSGAKQIGSSGVGDTPYVIDAQNKDRYPLMETFNTTFGALQTTLPRISLVSPLNQTYYDSNVSLNFSVDVLSPVKSVNWTGYSLDGEPNVTVTGSGPLANVTLADMANGAHNVTVYANDTYGNMASETVTFTVEKPEPFPTTLVATASGLSVAIVGVGLLLYFKKRKH